MKPLSRLLLSLLLLLALLSGGGAPKVEAAPTSAYDTAQATYKIVAYDSNPFLRGEGLWSGTAWKVSPDEMVTAGHVCDPDGGPVPVFRVFNIKGQSWPAEVIAWERDDGHDLCVLKADPPGPFLTLAPDLPAYDSPLFFVGAPYGIWGEDMRPIYHGRYAGGGLAVIGGGPGASGSAMQSEQGVIGVLVAGIPGTQLIFFIPLQALRAFLDENGV